MQIEGLTKRVAEELKISQELSEEVCRSEFKFIVEMIKLRKAVNCIYLGKFIQHIRYQKLDAFREEHGTNSTKGDI